jgi:hypothetical protein
MSLNQRGLCAALGIGVIIALYYATQNTPGNSAPIPKIQGEAQVMGMGVQSSVQFRVNPGTALDMRPECHCWVPAYDPDPTATPVCKTKHRYPAIPGGNISTVMHKGWSAFTECAPADNDWIENPPEAAVI